MYVFVVFRIFVNWCTHCMSMEQSISWETNRWCDQLSVHSVPVWNTSSLRCVHTGMPLVPIYSRITLEVSVLTGLRGRLVTCPMFKGISRSPLLIICNIYCFRLQWFCSKGDFFGGRGRGRGGRSLNCLFGWWKSNFRLKKFSRIFVKQWQCALRRACWLIPGPVKYKCCQTSAASVVMLEVHSTCMQPLTEMSARYISWG